MATKTFKIATTRRAAQPRSARLRGRAAGGSGMAVAIVETLPGSGSGSGSGDGHTHANLWALSQLGFDNGYAMAGGSKAKAGYADEAGNLAASSPAWAEMAARFEPLRNDPLIIDEGPWAAGGDYKCARPGSDGRLATSDVWHSGCRWRCLADGTAQEPAWRCSGWVLLEGDTRFWVRFAEPEQLYSADNFRGTLTVEAFIGSMDVTADVEDSDVEWTRRSEWRDGTQRAVSDALWAQRRGNSGKQLAFDVSDVDIDSQGWPSALTYTATVTLADGSAAQASFSYPL